MVFATDICIVCTPTMIAIAIPVVSIISPIIHPRLTESWQAVKAMSTSGVPAGSAPVAIGDVGSPYTSNPKLYILNPNPNPSRIWDPRNPPRIPTQTRNPAISTCAALDPSVAPFSGSPHVQAACIQSWQGSRWTTAQRHTRDVTT